MMRSFRSQVALLFGATAMAVVAFISVITTRMLSNHVTADQGQALQVLAHSTAAMLGEGLHERLREIELMADAFGTADEGLTSPRVHHALQRAQQTRNQYSWIGLTTAAGEVRLATKGMLIGKNVSARPWFAGALQGPFVGDVHEAKLLAAMLPKSETGEPLRFVDFAAPVKGPGGDIRGVLGAHANWDWVRGVIRSLRSDRARNQGVRVFILDKYGQIIHRPDGPEGQIEPSPSAPLPYQHGTVAWSDGQRYLSATAKLNHPDSRTQLGWTIVVRQPESQALAAAASLRSTMLWLGAAGAVLAMGLAWLAAGRVSGPLQRLTQAASRIRAGELDASLPPPEGSRELRAVTRAMRELIQALQQRQHELAQANASLEEKVQARTQELERANAELAHLAQRDGLTGLYNRRTAEERMDQECARHRRSSKVFSLLVLDIDHFKRINDTFGHASGDEALRRVAACLGSHCRTTDFVARIGGEEFLLLLPETALQGALEVGEKLRCAVSELKIPDVGMVTISVGVAQSHLDDSQPIRTVLKSADDALYRAKATGRNRVVTSVEEAHA